MESKKDMKGFRIIGYGLGSLGKDLALGVMGTYLLLFYTDILGIPAAAAGMIFLVTKIWDAVNDPMMGAIADRSPITRWGKYRPYVLLTALPLSVMCVLCFIAPDLSVGGKVAYAAITYTLTGMVFTAYDVPLWSMVPSLSEDDNVKNKLIASGRTFTALGMFLASSVAFVMIQKLGGGAELDNLKKGYPLFMVIIGVISVFFAVIAFLSTKEIRGYQGEKPQGNIFKTFNMVMCKPLVMVLLTMMCSSIAMLLPGICGTYYMIYYLQRPDLIGAYMGVCMGIGIAASIISPALLKKISSQNLTKAAFLVDIFAGIVIFIVGKNNIPIAFICFGVMGLMTGLLNVTITTMLTETARYITETKHLQADGICFSLNSFAIKVGQALASAAVSFLLAATGYVANAPQSDTALLGMLLSRSLLPAAIAVLGIVFASQWNITVKKDKE